MVFKWTKSWKGFATDMPTPPIHWPHVPEVDKLRSLHACAMAVHNHNKDGDNRPLIFADVINLPYFSLNDDQGELQF